MVFCRKKTKAFKAKVRKRLKSKNVDIKKIRNSETILEGEVILLKKYSKNMDSTIQEKDRLISDLRKEISFLQKESDKFCKKIEEDSNIMSEIAEEYRYIKAENKTLHHKLMVCENRIKYEFKEE